MPATPKEGVLYLNIGNIFERYSNGRHVQFRLAWTLTDLNFVNRFLSGSYAPRVDSVSCEWA